MKRMNVPLPARELPPPFTTKEKLGVAILALAVGSGIGLILVGILTHFARR